MHTEATPMTTKSVLVESVDGDDRVDGNGKCNIAIDDVYEHDIHGYLTSTIMVRVWVWILFSLGEVWPWASPNSGPHGHDNLKRGVSASSIILLHWLL